MARSRKFNAEYFKHDSDMRNDPKIKALRKKYSFKGYAIWCFILEILSDSDNFEIEWDELNIELLSGDFDCEVNELTDIVNYCIKVKLLEINDTKLVCSNLKDRFESLITKRKKDLDRYYATESKQSESFRSENPDSRVEYSRVEQNRVENIKEENINILSSNDKNDISNEEDKEVGVLFPAFDLSKEEEFKDSIAFEKSVFEAALRKEQKLGVDIFYYQNLVNDWNATIRIKDKRKKRTARGWIATCRKFMRDDNAKGKLRFVGSKKEFQDAEAKAFLSI